MIPKDSGKIAPATPWITRPTISNSMECEIAQTNEPTPNVINVITSTFSLPNMSPSRPTIGVATEARTSTRDPQGTGHYLRQFGPTGAETASVHPNRLETNRGNTYINPLSLTGPEQARRGIVASFDCKNTTSETQDKPDNSSSPACFNQPPYDFGGALRKFPHVERDDYSKGG